MNELELYKGNRITLMACSSCNAKCSDCYIGYTGNRTPDDLYNIAYLLMNDGKHVRIDGAEVLTNLDYLKTLKLVGQNWIMTNGFRIYSEPDIIDLLRDNNIDTVYMSYHYGIQEDINSISLTIVEDVIKLLNKNNFNIYLNCTLTNRNYKDIKYIAEKTYQLGAKGVGFNKIFQQGKAKNIENLDLTKEQLKEFFEDLNYLRNHHDKNEFYITRGGSLGHDTFKGKDNLRCNAGNNHVMITPDSKVYGCNAICRPGYEIGEFINNKVYLYKKFYHDESVCLAELLGYLNEDNMDNLTYDKYPVLVKKYSNKK